jgi:hypothetical protein
VANQQAPGGDTKTDWHRLFGLLLVDFFTGSPYEVEAEKDLSLYQQLLDVVIVRKKKGIFHERLPDGLDDLVTHNLISFKSFQESLDAWSLKELVGHYVNYRKQLSQRNEPLLPEERFRLYAVCCRHPHNLAQAVALTKRQDGVFDCHWGTDRIRIVVAADLPQVEHNAALHLFSASGKQFQFGRAHYHMRSPLTSTLLYQLFRGYQVEGVPMPITLEEFYRDWVAKNLDKILADASPEQRVAGLTPEQRTRDVSTEELERLLEQRRAAEASAKKPKNGGKPGRGSPKRGTK